MEKEHSAQDQGHSAKDNDAVRGRVDQRADRAIYYDKQDNIVQIEYLDDDAKRREITHVEGLPYNAVLTLEVSGNQEEVTSFMEGLQLDPKGNGRKHDDPEERYSYSVDSKLLPEKVYYFFDCQKGDIPWQNIGNAFKSVSCAQPQRPSNLRIIVYSGCPSGCWSHSCLGAYSCMGIGSGGRCCG